VGYGLSFEHGAKIQNFPIAGTSTPWHYVNGAQIFMHFLGFMMLKMGRDPIQSPQFPLHQQDKPRKKVGFLRHRL
jgi:hypothetical protein